ncbi:hypothetical protein [Clostridium butyricum]|uniref:hypothetical protein n=1 Tax=Clostridium butyricum TaxID=1492 RepID=UPI00374E6DD5
MNRKRKYLKNKKNHVRSCEYFKRCYKNCREKWIKEHFKIYYKEAVNTLKELNDKYYKIRAEFRFIKQTQALFLEYDHATYLRSKAHYLKYVKNK